MERPALVADCVAAMAAAAPVEVTVKCRIGVDEQRPEAVLPDFLLHLAGAGVRRVTIHARKAWLRGLSPKENREVPPLDHGLVQAMKREFPHLHVSVNGGIASLAEARALLAGGLDGVMFGRAAYHEPYEILAQADALIFGGKPGPDRFAVVDGMRPYIARHLAAGGRLNQITRHMLGLFHGEPGARTWRRVLSERAGAPGAGLAVIDAALAPMRNLAA
jgi:tRNA-dihydrouridine synthase A